ncbi:tetratricopeptide repeat-containing hybrid sensor histidine kinase/response regulator [Robertkochia aurantiaca]|uniref:tetratricopeptide repeat-containing hybrid sensor histidine kinase/response regulator n=1 Tax=Robertkochia aurantiaca TaxID=2873700 RepID=UPI001CCCEBA2|nr:response regulator [Robertkochia sp. 3YJGBD-33]
MAAQDELVLQDSLQSLIGKIYQFKNQGDFQKAVEAIDQGKSVASLLDDREAIAKMQNLLARVYIEQGKNFDPAEILSRAQDLYEVKDIEKERAVSSILQAFLAAKNGKEERATELIREAFSAADYSDKSHLSVLLFYEARSYQELNKKEKAKVTFKKLIPPYHRFEQEYLYCASQYHFAELYLDMDNKKSARLLLQNTLDYAYRFTFPKYMVFANNKLYELAENDGDYKQALAFYKAADSLERIYFNAELLKVENELAMKKVTESMRNTINQLEEQQEKSDQEVSVSKLTSVLSSALLIIISLLTISLYRNNQIKFKTNDLLLKKNNELQLAKEEAERAMKAKSQFLSTVSHELRTPLYAVTGLTHLLLEEDPKESQKEHLQSLKFSGEYLLNFINDILQINKIDANKLALELEEFDLRHTMEDVCAAMHQTAKQNDNEIVVEIDPDIPDTLIGDKLKLSQIFLNLVGNALKFTENGKVTIIAKTRKKHDDSIDIHFEVNDEGIGISKEMQENIFESFSQGSVQINRKYGGTGLGLTIVKSLLGLFDSNISLSSELGVGSSFRFDISFDLPQTQTQETQHAVKQTADAEVKVSDDFFKGLRVLVVEDNKINQVITQKMLGKKDISCEIANNGYEAIDMAKENSYDLILMDIHMPGISGLKATEEIREFDKEIPIIALTAITLDESLDDFFASGCTDIITKPFKPETFYGVIAKALQQRKNSA